MARTMYDSVTPTDIPTSAQMVAGYSDGAYAWSDAGWLRFPNARKVSITVTGQDLNANVADCETGDLTPAQAAAWAKRRHDAGGFPVIYFSRSLFATVAAAVHAAGLNDSQWAAWIADWTGVAHNLPNTLATQYDHPPHSGGHYDLSEVSDYWPGVDPVPAPAPAPTPIPAPVPGPPLDQARAAWAQLGELLITDFPGAITAVEAAIAKIRNLP